MKHIYRILHTAFHALRRNVMRSLLTCLGIIIGIAAVIAMMEIGQGSSFTIQQTIAKMGANVIQLDPDASNIGGVSTGAGGKATLTPEDCDAINHECDAVRWAAPSVDSWGQARLRQSQLVAAPTSGLHACLPAGARLDTNERRSRFHR